MKISYAITVCTEAQEFKTLLDALVAQIREEDELVILQDVSKGEVEEVSKTIRECSRKLVWKQAEFGGNFASWKNLLNSFCSGDFIFQLDADEIPAEALISNLPAILEANPTVDIIWVPRANTVDGITAEDIRRWHWRVNEQGYINWPDLQGRIYRNSSDLKWEGAVHERIAGFQKYSFLPEMMLLYHRKGIEKQREQNNYYDTIVRDEK